MSTAGRDASDYDAISYTALKVLQQRARDCEIPMCRELADAAGIPWQTSWLRSTLKRLIGGKVQSGLYLQLRHDAISRALEAYAGCAVLELSAGYGTRGINECSAREAYIETDLPSLVLRKAELVGRVRDGNTVPNHYFSALNVMERSDFDAMQDFVGRLGLSKPLVIIHEGLLMYFNDQELETVRDGISRLMRSQAQGAVWLTPDFSERDIDQRLGQRLLSLKLRRRVGRRLNYFSDNDAVEKFLKNGGLRCDWLPSPFSGRDRAARDYAEFFRVHRITSGA